MQRHLSAHILLLENYYADFVNEKRPLSVISARKNSTNQLYLPYLNATFRQYYFLCPTEVLDKLVQDCDIIHVPFLPHEELICRAWIHKRTTQVDYNRLGVSSQLKLLEFDKLEGFLLGRNSADLQSWWSDCLQDSCTAWFGDQVILHRPASSYSHSGCTTLSDQYSLILNRKLGKHLLRFRDFNSALRSGFDPDFDPCTCQLNNCKFSKSIFEGFSDHASIMGFVRQNPYSQVIKAPVNSAAFTCIRAFPGGFISSSNTFNELHYNREGEVIMTQVWGAQPRFHTLHAHASRVTNPEILDESCLFYHTVTDIQLCSSTPHFFTSSWDGTIKVWERGSFSNVALEEGMRENPTSRSSINQQTLLNDLPVRHCGTWRGHIGHVNAMALHRSELILASAGKDGRVILWPFDLGSSLSSDKDTYGLSSNIITASSAPSNGGLKGKGSCLVQKAPKDDMNFVDSLLFLPGSDTLVTATGFDLNRNRGMIDLYDGVTMTHLSGISSIAAGISAMQASPNGRLLAIGTGIYKDSLAGDGVMRLFDVRYVDAVGRTNAATSPDASLVFRTEHRNVDSISFSPDTSLIASCDASTHQILLFDLRKSSIPVFQMSHSPEVRGGRFATTVKAEDAYVALEWLSPKLLMTGGLDGVLNLWDLSSCGDGSLLPSPQYHSFTGVASPSVVRSWEVDQPINVIAASSDRVTVAVGIENGCLIIFSLDAAVQHASFAFSYGPSPTH